MTLIDRISRALNERRLDPAAFERTACALLRERYPWLSPIEGGTDLGRDADVYRALPGVPDSKGRLLATTGDPLANFRRSRPRWEKEGLRVDQIVIACSQPVSGKTRQKLEAECEKEGLPLPEIFGQDWLIAELVKNQYWREYLIGISGRLEALPRRPFDVNPPDTAITGRDDSIEAARARLAAGGDLVVAGPPGVGKTRLLLELGDGVRFVEPAARNYLSDDLIAIQPTTVVVDDAQLHLDLLAEIVRLRAQERLPFSIVAATWPDSSGAVAEMLRDPLRVKVEPLAMDRMDEIVQAAGVTGVHARHLVLEQAEGRPGWALALCATIVAGDGMDVVSGEALLTQVERHLRQVSDSRTALDVLACIAALRTASHEDLELVATLVGEPLTTVVDSIHRVATNGLIDQIDGKWRLQPSLGQPLVGRWFFGDAKFRSWRSLEDAFPERVQDLRLMMLGAASLDPEGPSGDAADHWAATLPSVADWDRTTMALVDAYATVSERAADFASRAANAVLAAPRELEGSRWGRSHDVMGTAAEGILRGCAWRWFNEESVHGLLTLAVSDDRSQPQTPEHPMRVLGDMAQHLDPDSGPIFETRTLLLRYVLAWLQKDEPTNDEWRTACEAIRHAFTPSVAGTWSEPGGPHTFAMAHGVESPERLTALIGHWTEVDQLLSSPLGSAISTDALIQLLELLEEWIRLASGTEANTRPIWANQRAAGAAGARSIFASLRPLIDGVPGLALRAQQILDLGEEWGVTELETSAPLALEEDLLLLVARRAPGEDIESWLSRRDAGSKELARRIADLGSAEGTQHLATLLEQATQAGSNDDARVVAGYLARDVLDRERWLAAASEAALPALVYRLIVEARMEDQSISETLIRTCLASGTTRQATLRAFLDGDTFDAVAELVIASLTPSDAGVLDGLFVKSDPDPILRALLDHDCTEVRAMTAVSFAIDDEHGPSLPPEWRTDWERAFLDAEPASLSGHSEWRLSELLKKLAATDPDLCARWYIHRLARPLSPSWSSDWSRLEPIAAMLPRLQREKIARACCEDPQRTRTLLHQVAGHDPELASELIAEGAIMAERGMALLSGERDDAAKTLIPVLLECGVAPRKIAQKLCSARDWTGSESHAIQTDIDWFNNFRMETPAAALFCEAAIDLLERERDLALEEERVEAVRGWP